MNAPHGQVAIDGLEAQQMLILFDGHCNLCNGAVQFVIKRDNKDRFRFAALSWPAGDALRQKFPVLQEADSIVCYDGDKVWLRSSAALKIAGKMGGLWPAFGIFWVVPRPLRDAVYSFVARNRYRWFGRKDACMLPTPALQNKFLKQ
jgi:predicted DCC family thiol-disulfide oxidoreductase YuxK